MSNYSFDELGRQSPKGIVINYGVLLYKLVKSFWVFIPIVFSDSIDNKLNYILCLLGILALVLLVVAVVQYLYFKFKIDGDYFILNQGMIFKKKTSIPLDRIQSVNFKQNLIHQLINLTQVEIQTAGAKDIEVSIKAISRQKAEALKKRLQNNIESVISDEVLNEVAEVNEGKLIYKLSIIDLLKVSFSENHIRSFFWIIAIVFSFSYQLRDYFKDFDFVGQAINYAVNNKSLFTGSLLLLGLAFVIGLIISIVVSFVRVFLRHFEQNVIKKNDGIQVSEGLFTRREDVLKIKKIQYSVTVTNPIKQKLGIQTIKIKQAGSAKTKKKKLVQLVGVKNLFLSQLNQLFFNYEPTDNKETYKPSRYYLFRIFVRTFILLLIINFVFFLNQLSIMNWILANALIIPIAILMVLLKFKKTYFDFDGKTLLVGNGKIGTVTTIIEYFKTQNVTYSQSFIQKRRGVATLKLQTASGVIKLPCLHEEDARTIQERIVSEVEGSTKDWI